MIRNRLHKIIMLALLTVANTPFTSFSNSQLNNTSITIEYIKGGTLEEEKKVFIKSFKHAYKNIPLDVLKVESLDSFL